MKKVPIHIQTLLSYEVYYDAINNVYTNKIMLGDVDNNGFIDKSDATYIMKYVSGII